MVIDVWYVYFCGLAGLWPLQSIMELKVRDSSHPLKCWNMETMFGGWSMESMFAKKKKIETHADRK